MPGSTRSTRSTRSTPKLQPELEPAPALGPRHPIRTYAHAHPRQSLYPSLAPCRALLYPRPRRECCALVATRCTHTCLIPPQPQSLIIPHSLHTAQYLCTDSPFNLFGPSKPFILRNKRSTRTLDPRSSASAASARSGGAVSGRDELESPVGPNPHPGLAPGWAGACLLRKRFTRTQLIGPKLPPEHAPLLSIAPSRP